MKRLGMNHAGYSGEQIEIDSTLRRCADAAHFHGWLVESMPPGPLGRWAAHRAVERGGPRVYISAGIHGDEPAGPAAVERLLAENRWPKAEIVIAPCLNPEGMRRNIRENPQGYDLNRDYRRLATPEAAGHVEWLQRQAPFDLTLLLHEDWESHGFYCYELLGDGAESVADQIIAAVSKVCPIDPSEWIEGRKVSRPGILAPSISPETREDWPEALWMARGRTRRNYTLEAPSDWPLPVRVAALVEAVRAAIAGVIESGGLCGFSVGAAA